MLCERARAAKGRRLSTGIVLVATEESCQIFNVRPSHIGCMPLDGVDLFMLSIQEVSFLLVHFTPLHSYTC